MTLRRRFSALAVLGLLALTAAGVGVWTSNAVGAGVDPPSGVTFYALEASGNTISFFSELELRSGFVDPSKLSSGANGVALPSKSAPNSTPAPPTARLTRGLTTDTQLSAWHELALTGAESARKNVSLVMFDATGARVARYDLQNAWPAKLELESGEPDVLTEAVTLVADQLHRVSP